MKEKILVRSFTRQPMPFWKIVLLAGLFVGTFDIAAAIIQTLLNGRKPLRMLQFIASGMFGKRAFSGGVGFGLFGLLFHYCIALAWTWLYFQAYPAIKFLQKQRILAAMGFGLLIWVIMSQVVMPLSNTPPLPFKLKEAVIQMLIIFVTISLPLSLIAHAYYMRRLEGVTHNNSHPVANDPGGEYV